MDELADLADSGSHLQPDPDAGVLGMDVKKSGRFEIPNGWICQSFVFTLDLSSHQQELISRQFGGRRYAYNWTLRTIKMDLDRRLDSTDSIPSKGPSFYSLQKRWNAQKGSIRFRSTAEKISVLNTKIANTRSHHIHVLTTRLAKTHGTVVIEGLNVADMYRDKSSCNSRALRRGLSDSAFGEFRRQLRYKSKWYGSTLVEADRWFASPKTCHVCNYVQEIGVSDLWTCKRCDASHHRDDIAAINLARWPERVGESDLGGVAAPVKRGAMRKTGHFPAASAETRKRPTETESATP